MRPTKTPEVDLLIVHQFDPARPVPGGIDTCIRGVLKYQRHFARVAVVGVDATIDPGRALGDWETHDVGGGPFQFLPVARLDPADQSRRIPHSLRLAGGLVRFRGELPRARYVQTHRADLATVIDALVHRQVGDLYFIHTQSEGLSRGTSDSLWTTAAPVHEAIERRAISKAVGVAVFNPEYGLDLSMRYAHAFAMPTWYDPAITQRAASARQPRRTLWVGRMEPPKDPMLALDVQRYLTETYPSEGWRLVMVGDGTLHDDVCGRAEHIAGVTVTGRLPPEEVARQMAIASSLMMTSVPGYEGFPRVLVEAMASGAVPVVTGGSDTGALVAHSANGFVTTRIPSEIGEALRAAEYISPTAAQATALRLSAPTVIADLYSRLTGGHTG